MPHPILTSLSQRKVRRRIGLAAAIAVAGAVIAPVAAHGAQAQPTAVQQRSDFNGDGYEDLAVAASQATVGGKARAGYVAVVYGSANGLDLAHRQVVSQNSAGVPGTAEADDYYGDSLSAGDLDGDGYADLVVGAPGEDVGEIRDPGTLAVLWGGSNGLSGGTGVATGEDVHDLDVRTAVGDFDGDGHLDLATPDRVLAGPFSRTTGAAGVTALKLDASYVTDDLAAGDVDHDGVTDLVALIHDPSDSDTHDPDAFNRRAVHLRGTADGLGAPATLKNPDGTVMRGGESVGIGDVDKDGYGDVVIGRTNDGWGEVPDVDPQLIGGQIGVVYGSAAGPDTSRTTTITQDTPGVPGAAEFSDSFGGDIAVADVNGDGYADVAAGSGGEDLGDVFAAGQVNVLRGSAAGLTGTGATSFSQNSADVPGTAEQNDYFGSGTALVDTDRDGRAELFAGAVSENQGDGAVWAFPSTGAGPTATGSLSFGAGTLGTDPADANLGGEFAR
ncbi:FG-GAP repeat protein [Streptomyces sp. GESEQ-35]|uniref:FG-GAP repeat protein n=1 Tax=Streptomyces sp. GESEQ-35 TaxID=2812657 RepID=UPI0027E3823C|nr:FG-GAP repeat protein [Streptomyces sp. GESEQ-35]